MKYQELIKKDSKLSKNSKSTKKSLKITWMTEYCNVDGLSSSFIERWKLESRGWW